MSAPTVEVLEEALKVAGLPEVELYCRQARRGVSRFSRAELNQNAAYDERIISARVAVNRRVGTSTTTALDVESIASAIREAGEVARLTPPVPDFPGFAGREPEPPPLERAARSTAESSPGRRAESIARMLEPIRKAGLDAAGVVETTAAESAVVTTAGARRHVDTTIANARLFVIGPDSSAYGGGTHRDIDALDLDALTARALERCQRGAAPIELPPGSYDVVLEPEAVTELLEWFAFTSLSARDVEDGSSAFAGRIGTPITGAWVDLVDDALDASELGLGSPFDPEGTTRRRVELIEGGVARAVVTDRLHAARAGAPSTGHAMIAGSDDVGPRPVNLFLGAGDRTTEELIGMVDRGLYVTRFHYVNGLLDPRRSLMTGMTRDGTFLIEKGKLTRGVANMRFTESLLGALERTEAASAGRRAVPTWWSDGGAHVAPAILVRGFRFTGDRAP